MSIQIIHSTKYADFQLRSTTMPQERADLFYGERVYAALGNNEKEVDVPVIYNRENDAVRYVLNFIAALIDNVEEDIEVNVFASKNFGEDEPLYKNVTNTYQTEAKQTPHYSQPTNHHYMSFITASTSVVKNEENEVEEEKIDAQYDSIPAMPLEEDFGDDYYTIEEYVEDLGMSFSKAVLAIIDEHHWKDSDVYHRSNITKSVFSTLRSNNDYQPTKNTALALVVGLQLSVSEANELLEKAGYILSNSDLTDRIVEYHLRKKDYNIMNVNADLDCYNRKILGAK